MDLALEVPRYSTLSRRAATAAIALPKRSEGPLHLVPDSTGLKHFGEGKWEVRRHGAPRRRTWRKPHLAVDAVTHELQAVMLSTEVAGRSRAPDVPTHPGMAVTVRVP